MFYRLEQAEERYRNRDSRPEDLERIEDLKTMTTERELECKKMLVSEPVFLLRAFFTCRVLSVLKKVFEEVPVMANRNI